jgi:multicomponent Na+:H+ antiporter subunit A
MTGILIVILIISGSIFFIPEKLKPYKAFLPALGQLGAFIFFVTKIPQIANNEKLTTFIEWIPQLGLNFSFVLDGLSLVFALLITGIGTLVFVYAHPYMKRYAGTEKFFMYLMLFSGAMLGLVLSDNLIALFIFWELTSYLSFFLITFFHEKESARRAAFQSLYITGFGGLSMLAGILLLGSVVNSYSVSEWITNADVLKESSLYLPGLLLILLGVMTKSAQFPYHFWLPGAMQAPAPVSSYLHSATMVKAGVFLLARLNPALGGTEEWLIIIPVIGVLTMLTGSYFAVTQTDLKGILAYTTINALGVLVLLIGIDSAASIKAAILFLFIHAFYKATLFMVAGLIEKKTGTRDLSKLGGLIKSMPLTFLFSFLALLSMAGLPPMLGFLGKELIYEAKVQSPGLGSLILVLGVISNIFMIAVSLFFIRNVFLGKKPEYDKQPNEKGLAFLVGPAVLALLSLVLGLAPGKLGSTLVEPALEIVAIENVQVKLKIWHGFNTVFFLSLGTVFAGFALFFAMVNKRSLLNSWRKLNSVLFSLDLSVVFHSFMDYFARAAKFKTKTVQHGYHRIYILTIIIFTSMLLWFQFFVTRQWNFELDFSIKPFYISGLVVVIVLATVFSTLSKSRIVTIIAMGVVGYGIALIFLHYSAIDLAITQILVETLTLVMFVLVLQRLPLFARLSKTRTRIRDFAIALSFGGVMTLLALKAVNVNLHHPISDYFLENSYTKAFGENVVNVILVDFRALDTLGEVTVLVIAAIGVWTLLKTKEKKT